MSENEFPSGWVLTSLENIGQIVSGGTPATTVAEYWGGSISWISPVDLSKYDKKIITKGGKSITELGLLKSSAKLMPKGSILFSSRAPIGYVAISGQELCTNQGFKSVIPNDSIFNEYLYYFLKSAKRQADELASGTTFKEISLSNFATIKIPLPPLPEQHRIVAKIEELFSELDKGIESLKTAQQQLKVYRQAVLKYAFEGKLTNPEVKDGELPEGWEWVASGDLFSFVTSGSRGWAKYYSESGSIFIRITNLNFDTLNLDLRKEKIQYVNPPQNSEGLRTKVEEGDFLFSITGYLGMFAIAPKVESAFVNQHVALCRPKDFFNKKYLAYWIIAKSGGHYYLNKNQKGAVKAGLNLDDLKTFPVPLPSTIEEQTQIVQAIESRLSVCDKIEESIAQSLQQAEALRQSILKKAFEGKLVPQDPNDEPAGVLLARIQAARTQAQPAKKTRTNQEKA